ncbi:MAG: hypothetical protein HC852_22025 [Acaryochloridaceae cyanobacterium RU_4_10]|nr:hypothetical protein [Acaryochloridaceae cyanobacterium RU_4_10]
MSPAPIVIAILVIIVVFWVVRRLMLLFEYSANINVAITTATVSTAKGNNPKTYVDS